MPAVSAARTFRFLSGALIATAILVPRSMGPAGAQEQDVRLTLVGQTSFAAPGDPVQIRVRATNEGTQTFGDLTVSLTIYNPTRSRSEYREGLDSEPPTAPLILASQPAAGTLEPGGARRFRIPRELPELEGNGDNALYPMKVQVESEGIAIADLRTAFVFIREEPLVPLNVSVTVVVDEPIPAGSGRLLTDALETSIAGDGRLNGLLATLERTPIRMTLVLSPILLSELAEMSDGYVVPGGDGPRRVGPNEAGARRAEETLERIRRLARLAETEVVALPYARPQVPALLAAGVAGDLQRQIVRGREEVERLLSVSPVRSIFRPPGSVLSEDAIRALVDEGVATLIVDADTLPPPEGLVLSPGARARIGVGDGITLDAVAPDPDVSELSAELPDDPRLRAQWVIGDLSALYFEQPSVVRGAALVFDATADAPDARFLSSLLSVLDRVPDDLDWLDPEKVARLVAEVPAERRALPREPFETFSPAYLDRLAETRQVIEEFLQAAPSARLPDRLATRVLIAEAQEFLDREADGLGFMEGIRDRVFREFGKVDPPAPGTVVTLTSRGGDIPVTLRNLAGYPMTVEVTLTSPRLEFLGDGASREVNLTRESHVLTFPVRAQVNGRFPVQIVVATPGPGGVQMAVSRIVVRSTVYNRVALILTIGAAAFLALWWGRRFVQRRTS